MAEQVNQRIENMINELEQMRRTNLYEDDEIKEISRKRKEFEYRIQRRLKAKDDFVHYIAYELALLEDIALRRKQAKLTEKKHDIEYSIAKRLNKVFKQFILRFQNDIEIYFEYIKFCMSVGFDYAVSNIIAQMIQFHGDKPKVWQLASKWESKEQDNLENARSFLLKGIHRHPESEMLYIELFETELLMACKAESDEEKEKLIKRASVVWKNGMNNISKLSYLFSICDLSMKFAFEESITNEIKAEIWSRQEEKDVWCYIAQKELEGYHWTEIEEFINFENNLPNEINNYMGVYEEALTKFPDEKLCTKYIHNLLSVNESLCTETQKIFAVKQAWNYGHENGLLSNEMYAFGISLLKLEDEIPKDEFAEILDAALVKNPQATSVWEEKLLLNISNESKMLSILQEAGKVLKPDESLHLWNVMLDNVESNVVLQKCQVQFQRCENALILSLKPKLLQKIYRHNGLKAAREMYENFIRVPPTQVEVHKTMISIEKSQENPSIKNIRKCYECLLQHHGKDNTEIWTDYIDFENQNGSAQNTPAIYRRAVATLNKEIVDEFIKAQALARLKL
ncbi:U3 small nucleolar RNA-associated protein 6 homolog [Epargyreus clarus]|uniref:U3 small nucleolar RNA-associated protein 6 homolog n=1 Tax=Epargyreus clarus TaxID=520877 RepID=UPI003C2E7A31